MNLSILYRGPLSSCNYACVYCPFAKHAETAGELATDRRALERFTNWVNDHPQYNISILFTPWGEALIRRWYQDALATLSAMPHVAKVAIQTNLSCSLMWIDDCDLQALALWTTFHPTEVPVAKFLAKCHALSRRGVRFSVGVVGLKEHMSVIATLRENLPADIYLWINAYKRERNYYTNEQIDWLTNVDPLFPINNQYHASRGKACRTGHEVISVSGDGTIRRCHFIRQPLGNLYADDLTTILKPSPCTNETCGCHIGYVHLVDLQLEKIFGTGILERIPAHVRSFSHDQECFSCEEMSLGEK